MMWPVKSWVGRLWRFGACFGVKMFIMEVLLDRWWWLWRESWRKTSVYSAYSKCSYWGETNGARLVILPLGQAAVVCAVVSHTHIYVHSLICSISWLHGVTLPHSSFQGTIMMLLNMTGAQSPENLCKQVSTPQGYVIGLGSGGGMVGSTVYCCSPLYLFTR